MPAIQALGEGYEVYIVTDASGGVTIEAHDMAVRRMVQAGAVPMTWLAVQAELQRDWARERSRAWARSLRSMAAAAESRWLGKCSFLQGSKSFLKAPRIWPAS